MGHRYSIPEEIANSVTHGLGAALAVAALSVLVTFAGLFGDVWRVVGFSVYGGSLVILYLFSTLYHAFQGARVKAVFQVLDHAAIYLLIAGTYTPLALVTLRGPWGWTMFGIIWACAVAGIVTTVAFLRAPRWVTASIYVAMGWLAVVALRPLVEALPAGGLALLAAGGLCYTGGVAFYLWERLPFHHAVWHLFVLGGSTCHFFCMVRYVLPMQPA
ncbi:MAG: hemolysin III family protein [Deltaproteobacteria bacterium]|nr:hemolysin III family protein [Deltaproteobacteria bacterium]